PLSAFFATTFALPATCRVGLALILAAWAAVMMRRAVSSVVWAALAATATLMVVSWAVVSHAVARVEWRATLIALDATHQIAAAVWVGGLAHLVLYAMGVVAGSARAEGGLFKRRRDSETPGTTFIEVPIIIRRFSMLAFRSMAVIVLAGVALTIGYVGDLAAFV